MRYRGGHRQQQARSGGERSGQATGSYHSDNPVRQFGDFRIGQHHDVAVHLQLVVTAFAVLYAAVTVLVLELEQTGGLPVLEPLRTGLVGHGAVNGGYRSGLHRLGQVVEGHGAHSRSGGVENADEHQRPTCRQPRVTYLGHGEEADDDVWQTGGTDHQREGVKDHVQRSGLLRRVLREAQIDQRLVQSGQQRGAIREAAEQTHLRDRVIRQLQRDEDCRNGVGHDQHTVLSNLGVGDALHAAKHRVDEHYTHTDEQPGLVVQLQEAGEGDTYTLHLTDYIGQRGDDQAEHRHHARGLRVVTVADELRHRELAELAQVGCQQHSQQHVTAGPAHQEQRGVVPHEGDQAGHRDKRCCGHPVCRCSHTVGDRVNTTARGIELARASGFGPDGDTNV